MRKLSMTKLFCSDVVINSFILSDLALHKLRRAILGKVTFPSLVDGLLR